MKTGRLIATALAGLVLSACSHISVYDSCTRPRHFKQFTWPSRLYYSLPDQDIHTLSPAVREAVSARIRARGEDPFFEIVAAKVSGRYLLLTVRGACVDCDRWYVYSTTRECVVGVFILGIQG